MPVVDYERAFLVVKEHVLSQRSHGQSGLLAAMAQAELDSMIPEGEEGFDARPPVRRSHLTLPNDKTPALTPAQEEPAHAGAS